MSDKQTVWTRLSEQMPTEYPSLIRWAEGHDFGVGIFHAAGVDAGTEGEFPFVTFFPVAKHLPLAGFKADQAEWAPIPK